MKDKIDWHKEPLKPETVITESYKTTQNVRRFFKHHVGTDIHFSREFMSWMKVHVGKTLNDAVKEYMRQKNNPL